MGSLKRNSSWLPRLAFGLLALLIAGCGQHLIGTTLRVSEGIGAPQQEGTLILVEVITPITREQAMALFRAADLRAAGLKDADVQHGTAVFVSPYRQTVLFAAQGLYALVNPNVGSLDSGLSACNPRCSYGGDAVVIRVAKRPAGGAGEPVLYILESIVEPRSVQGDCYYVPRGSRRALYCKSLESKGWEWDDSLFVKRPNSATNR
ncbi:MAG TPA: hypothetical protein VLB72_07810 [Burkholderiales bacterium]|nr:hypothetical protein [Burkholderiales bacterium]